MPWWLHLAPLPPALLLLLAGGGAPGTTVDAAAVASCPGLEGRYSVNGSTVMLSVTGGSTLLGTWSDASRPSFSGMVGDHCLGAAIFPGAEQYIFRYDSNAVTWSSGEVWEKGEAFATGRPATSEQHSNSTHEVPKAEFTTHGVHEEEHGHGEGHEHHEENQPVAITVAVMLFGMLVVNVGLLYLVNFRDENIRFSIYNMISVTMSVFAAVLVNQAIWTFLIEQILESPFPRGLNMEPSHLVNSFVGTIVFFVLWAGMSKLCWEFRDDHRLLYSAGHLGAHLCAFGGMNAFGEALRAGKYQGKGSFGLTILLNLGAWGLLICTRRVSRRVREKIFLGGESETDHAAAHYLDRGVTRAPIHEDHSPTKVALEEIQEGEDEAIVLILSYLWSQLLCQVSIGKLPDLHGHEMHDLADIQKMAGFSVLHFVLLFGIVVIVHRSPRRCKKAIRDYSPIVLKSLAMSMSWCLQLTSAWGMHYYFASIPVVTVQLVHVINAFFVSLASIIIILGLDRVADVIQEDERIKAGDINQLVLDRGDSRDLHRLPPKTMSHFEIPEDEVQDCARDNLKENNETEPQLLRLDVDELAEVAGKALSPQELAKVLRVIILSFGLLVALSWDKAIDAAEETIVHGIGSHFVICKVAIATILVLFVTPAWMWYIVPKAQKSEEDHRVDVQKEKAEDGISVSEINDDDDDSDSQE